jgi:hypothetical protein
MSMSLSELGSALCQEFDQRENELRILQSEVRRRINNDREEISAQKKIDGIELSSAKQLVFEDVSGLLGKYCFEGADLVKVLKLNIGIQREEMTSWAQELEVELMSWHKAGEYMLKKHVKASKSVPRLKGINSESV